MANAPASSLANFEGLARETFFGSLSAGQRRAALFVAELARSDLITMTAACHAAEQYGVASEPSCRRLIQRLRDLKLVNCGSSESKGKILTLTPLGESILCFEE